MDDASEPSSFDLEAYIVNYTGHAKIGRLLFIADKAKGTALELEALKFAADNLRKAQLDQIDKQALLRQERLETDLHGYKTNLIKESIRMGHNDLGDFYYDRGDMQNALKCYIRSRDYCTTSKHIVTMCLNIIRVSIEMAQFQHVPTYVSKAEQTPEVQSDALVSAKLRVASGLVFLNTKKYKLAARKFLEVSADLGTSYSDVVAPQDIALYGGLCALATFDRSELRTRVKTNLAFREYLELHPEVRELVNNFYSSRYTDCLNTLEALRPQLQLDLHAHPHINALFTQIRRRLLTQYTAPYTSVNLHHMATAFNTTTEALEKELASLIMDDHIQLRIDSSSKVLYARAANVRQATFSKVLAAGEAYLRESKALLLRASLLQRDVVQKGKGGRGEGGSGADGGGGGGAGGGGGRSRRGHHDRFNFGNLGGDNGPLSDLAAVANAFA